MSLGKTDILVRESIEKLGTRLTRALEKYSKLDDMVWVLKTSTPEFRKVLLSYRDDIGFITDWFTGEDIDIMVNDSLKSVARTMGTPPAPKGFTNKIIQQIKDEFKVQINGLLDSIFNRQRTKQARFKQEAILSKLTKIEAEKLGKGWTFFDSKTGRTYSTENVKGSWDRLNKAYGKFDKIKYQNGANYPLDIYARLKFQSVTREVNNRATRLDAKRLDVHTGKVSNHHAKDTCALFENAIFFFTKQDRTNFKKKFPESVHVHTWPTYEELKESKTHLFKFACRHRISVYPIESFNKSATSKLEATRDLPTSNEEANRTYIEIAKERKKRFNAV